MTDTGNGAIVTATEIDTEKTILEVRLILEQAARDRRTMTYTALAKRVTTAEFDMTMPTHRGMIGQVLDAIATETEAEGKGILPVLVVKKGTNRPSKGFFRFAEKAGRDVTKPDRLVLDEQAKVFAAYEEA